MAAAFVYTHLPETGTVLPPPQGPASAHPYLEGVGGPTFSLMTEWDDLVLAVRCGYEPPVRREDGGGEAAASCLQPWAVASIDDFYDALRFAFDRYRAAVLVSIRANRLRLFLPFANDAGWRRPGELAIPQPVAAYATAKMRDQKARVKERMIPDVSRWWLNGHVVCNVRPDNVWGESQLPALFDLMQAALAARPLPDVDLILNKRDCPLMPLGPASGPRLPVLSPYTSLAVADVPFPLADDWRAAASEDGSRQQRAALIDDDAQWAARAPRAVFRGSSTGRGITTETNIRLALALFAAQHRDLLDIKITRVNNRCQLVDAASGAVDYPRVVGIRNQLREAGAFGPFETIAAQAAKFRIAIYVRGHQAASRLGALFSHGFCVVMLAPPGEERDAPGCKAWFDDALVPYPWMHHEQQQQEQQQQAQQERQQSRSHRSRSDTSRSHRSRSDTSRSHRSRSDTSRSHRSKASVWLSNSRLPRTTRQCGSSR
jgi:hypothetical protein